MLKTILNPIIVGLFYLAGWVGTVIFIGVFFGVTAELIGYGYHTSRNYTHRILVK